MSLKPRKGARQARVLGGRIIAASEAWLPTGPTPTTLNAVGAVLPSVGYASLLTQAGGAVSLVGSPAVMPGVGYASVITQAVPGGSNSGFYKVKSRRVIVYRQAALNTTPQVLNAVGAALPAIGYASVIAQGAALVLPLSPQTIKGYASTIDVTAGSQSLVGTPAAMPPRGYASTIDVSAAGPQSLVGTPSQIAVTGWASTITQAQPTETMGGGHHHGGKPPRPREKATTFGQVDDSNTHALIAAVVALVVGEMLE